MSKPLELKTFPLWESLGGTMYTGDTQDDVVNVDFEVYRKRLTDAELAAEYWFDYSIYVRECSNILHCHEPYMEAAAVSFKEAERKCEILHRFATLPHYDEVP